MATYSVRSALDEKEMHVFRFNIKPDSVSKSEPGLLTMQSVSEGGQAVAEFPSTSDDFYFYSGQTTQAKDVDCALIWDEDAQEYTLHALSSFTKLTKVNKKPPKPSVKPLHTALASPRVPPPPSHSASTTTSATASPKRTASSPVPAPAASVAPRQRAASPLPSTILQSHQDQPPKAEPRPDLNRSYSQPIPQQSMKSLPPPSALGQANHFGNSDSEDSEEDDDEASASDDSEDFGDLASQMELGVSR